MYFLDGNSNFEEFSNNFLKALEILVQIVSKFIQYFEFARSFTVPHRLKVVRNEKQRESERRQMLGNGLGPYSDRGFIYNLKHAVFE